MNMNEFEFGLLPPLADDQPLIILYARRDQPRAIFRILFLFSDCTQYRLLSHPNDATDALAAWLMAERAAIERAHEKDSTCNLWIVLYEKSISAFLRMHRVQRVLDTPTQPRIPSAAFSDSLAELCDAYTHELLR